MLLDFQINTDYGQLEDRAQKKQSLIPGLEYSDRRAFRLTSALKSNCPYPCFVA